MQVIKNPLTIVAAFSGLAEVAATIVLLKLPSELQPVFIWFVMLFPTLLVVSFFLTLNFNRTVLYAPSDFTDEENYMRTLSSSLTASEVQKLGAPQSPAETRKLEAPTDMEEHKS